MVLLITGLMVFLGVHSIRIVADRWRENVKANGHLLRYKGLFSVASLAGLSLIVLGYGATRADPIFLWYPPVALAHVATLLMLVAFILLAAAYIPGNRIRLRLGHPMILGVKIWALAHLLANGRLGDVILFGAFLLWAVVDFASARRRAPSAGEMEAGNGTAGRDLLAVGVGAGLWLVFLFGLHRWLFGVSPLG